MGIFLKTSEINDQMLGGMSNQQATDHERNRLSVVWPQQIYSRGTHRSGATPVREHSEHTRPARVRRGGGGPGAGGWEDGAHHPVQALGGWGTHDTEPAVSAGRAEVRAP